MRVPLFLHTFRPEYVGVILNGWRYATPWGMCFMYQRVLCYVCGKGLRVLFVVIPSNLPIHPLKAQPIHRVSTTGYLRFAIWLSVLCKRSEAWLVARMSLRLARLPRTASSAQRSRRLRSTCVAAPVLLAHAEVIASEQKWYNVVNTYVSDGSTTFIATL